MIALPLLQIAEQPAPKLKPGGKLQTLAAYFQARPNQWIRAQDLFAVAGSCAWRTRISECRTRLGMTIENRVKTYEKYTVSEYRFVPDGQAQTA